MPLAAGDKPGAYEVLAALGAGGMVLIRRLLAKSRDERYPSMAEVRADLGRLSTTSVTAAADDGIDRKSTRLNSGHFVPSRMPSSA